jgi:hypothetical protein
MHVFVKILSYIVVFLIIQYVKATNTCTKTDLRCYYTKVCQTKYGKHKKHELLSSKIQKNSTLSEKNIKEDMASNTFYRPRSALARALYEKQRNDRNLQEFDKNEVSR